MNIQAFMDSIRERMSTDDNWDFAVNKCNEKEIEILCEDIEGTAAYIETQCTADELSWISEIWDHVAAKTQSIRFIRSLEVAIKKYPEEDENIIFEKTFNALMEPLTKILKRSFKKIRSILHSVTK